jgi:hypothetical protein
MGSIFAGVLGVVAAGPVCGAAAAQQLLRYRERTLSTRSVLLQIGLSRFTCAILLSATVCLEWCSFGGLTFLRQFVVPFCATAYM